VTTADDRALYEWVLRQRETRRQGKMKEGRIAQLDALGFSWGAAAVGEGAGGAGAPADAPPPAPPAPAPPVDATVASLEAAGASGGVKMGGGAAAVAVAAVAVIPVVPGVPVGASGAGEGAGARPSATDLAEARFDDQLKELVRPSHEPLEPFGQGNRSFDAGKSESEGPWRSRARPSQTAQTVPSCSEKRGARCARPGPRAS